MKKYELVKFINNEFSLDVHVSPLGDTIWMSVEDMSLLYGVDRTGISRHIKKNYMYGELEVHSTCAKNAHMGSKGVQVYNTKLFNLDVIIAVGYRVNSIMGTVFRRWANRVLKEYLLKGYVINENRVVVSNENYIELKNQVTNINNRLLTLEDKVLEKVYKIDKIFYNGEF